MPDERLPLRKFIKYGLSKGENQARMDGNAGPGGSLLTALSQAVRAVPQAARGTSSEGPAMGTVRDILAAKGARLITSYRG